MADALMAPFDEAAAKPEIGALVGRAVGRGHFVILSRLIGREAAAARALFGEEIDGSRAVELGLAWESVDEDAVEGRALELAARVAADPELARVAVGNFRKEVVNGAVS